MSNEHKIFNALKKLDENEHFKNHPIKGLDLSTKILYIRGLVFVMNIDNENHEKEYAYIKNILKCIDVPEKCLVETLETLNGESVDLAVKDFVEEIKNNDELKTAFMVDAVILTKQDGVIREEEKKIVDIFARHFSISDNQMDEIRQKAEEKYYSLLKDYSPLEERMVLVKGWTFWMGSNETNSSKGETPVHKVELDRFYIGKYPVTQREYKEVIGQNPSEFEGAENRPVESVSWYDAVMYCNGKSEKEGKEPYYEITCKRKQKGKVVAEVSIKGGEGYRLPTEAEWEFAAGGGEKTELFRYSGSNSLADVAWYKRNSKSPQPVGKKKPNELRIYDMSGNVNEWCWDWYDQDFYDKSPEKNPTGPESGSSRVLRGGSWQCANTICSHRVSDRHYEDPTHTSNNCGFCIARSPKAKELK
jgi:formylglycine-generating enzyme